MKDPEFKRSPSKLRLSGEPAAGSVDILATTGTPKEPEVGRWKIMVWSPESAGILYQGCETSMHLTRVHIYCAMRQSSRLS